MRLSLTNVKEKNAKKKKIPLDSKYNCSLYSPFNFLI